MQTRKAWKLRSVSLTRLKRRYLNIHQLVLTRPLVLTKKKCACDRTCNISIWVHTKIHIVDKHTIVTSLFMWGASVRLFNNHTSMQNDSITIFFIFNLSLWLLIISSYDMYHFCRVSSSPYYTPESLTRMLDPRKLAFRHWKSLEEKLLCHYHSIT